MSLHLSHTDVDDSDNSVTESELFYIEISRQEIEAKPIIFHELHSHSLYLKIEKDDLLFALDRPNFWLAFAKILSQKVPFIVKSKSSVLGYMNMPITPRQIEKFRDLLMA